MPLIAPVTAVSPLILEYCGHPSLLGAMRSIGVMEIFIGGPKSAISDIVHGRREITPEMAWLLGRALGTTPRFWLDLEMTYQLRLLENKDMPEVMAL